MIFNCACEPLALDSKCILLYNKAISTVRGEKQMIHRKFSVVCIAILSIICLLNSSISPQAGTPAETDLYTKIDAYLRSCAENAHIPSMSITIVNQDEVLFSQGYGGCESSDMPFLLGSVSKSFTAVCIMQLAEQGKINLQAALSTYLPHATDGDRITVRQLLNHTSGLGEHQTLETYKVINEQGTHHYANVNYSLLGELIEAVSGSSYGDYLTENVLEPLQLSHTAATLDKSRENGLIDGYINYWGVHIKKSHSYPSSKNAWITVPAGYLSASTNDLGTYLQMYLNGGNGILSLQSIDTMFYGDTVYVDDDVPYWYGYGWTTVNEPLSEPVLRHAGLVETGTSCVYILPERNIAIAIAANVNDYFVTNQMMDSLGWGVVLMFLENPPNELTDTAYVWSHLRIDLIMLAVLSVAFLPLCRLPKYRKKAENSSRLPVMLRLLCIHLVLPVVLLLLVPLFFATPLWVARAFVPDVFITVIVSSTLLFAGGLVKGVLLYKQIKRAK